jgi:hypothetical protein
LLGERVRFEGEVRLTKEGKGAKRERVKESPSRSWMAGRVTERAG